MKRPSPYGQRPKLMRLSKKALVRRLQDAARQCEEYASQARDDRSASLQARQDCEAKDKSIAELRRMVAHHENECARERAEHANTRVSIRASRDNLHQLLGDARNDLIREVAAHSAGVGSPYQVKHALERCEILERRTQEFERRIHILEQESHAHDRTE